LIFQSGMWAVSADVARSGSNGPRRAEQTPQRFRCCHVSRLSLGWHLDPLTCDAHGTRHRVLQPRSPTLLVDCGQRGVERCPHSPPHREARIDNKDEMTEHKTRNTVIHAAFRRDLARFDNALGGFPAGSRTRADQLDGAWDNSPISSITITRMRRPSSGPNSANSAPANRS
jgi:hypothetical protein